MDAFDDAFGESPSTVEGTEPVSKTNGNGFLLEDDVEAEDPAAEFLAREQNNFAGLEDDIPVVVGGDEAFSNGDLGNGNVITDDFISDANNDVLNDDFLSQPRPTSPYSSSSPQTVSMPREEPEKIRIWREEQKRRLELKDCEEEENKEKLRAAAKKELDEWYKTYDDQISKTRNTNRSAEQDGAAAVVNNSGGDDGKEWDRIANLCDFNPKSSKQQKDISRMRSLILQLKQNPPVQKQSKAGSSKAS